MVSAAIVQNLPNYLDQTDSTRFVNTLPLCATCILNLSTSTNYRTNSLLMSVSIQKSDKGVDIDNLLQDFPAVIYFTALDQVCWIGFHAGYSCQ